jgi:hypothetical protein
MLSELKRDLLPEQDRLRKLYKGEDLERRLKTAEAMGVTKMIERKLQLQAAKNKGVDVSDQEVVQAVEEMKKQGEAIDSADPNTARSIREQLTLMRVVDREVRGLIMGGGLGNETVLPGAPGSVCLPRGIPTQPNPDQAAHAGRPLRRARASRGAPGNPQARRTVRGSGPPLFPTEQMPHAAGGSAWFDKAS